MVKAVQWLLCTYVALKFLQYFFIPRSGFRQSELSFRERLLRGEPRLFIVALTIAVPAALLSDWYFKRGFERGLEHSADCYGKLSAVRNLEGVKGEFDSFRIYRQVEVTRQAVSLAARSLELTPDDADALMAEKASSYARRYAALSRQGNRQEQSAQAAAIRRCMSEPMISF